MGVLKLLELRDDDDDDCINIYGGWIWPMGQRKQEKMIHCNVYVICTKSVRETCVCV